MDILTHAISGTAVAACVSTFLKRSSTSKKIKVLFIGTFGAVLPDIDAISMWSQFDSKIGALFNLPYSGREIYGMKLWYSHHAFFHSLLASLFFGTLLLLFIYLIRKVVRKRMKNQSVFSFLQDYGIYFIVFVLGYWAHLAGDLPTPASVWGGIAFAWPSSVYWGGYGKIWWWNNYDVFLLILLSVFLILLVPVLSKWIKKRKRTFSVSILAITLMLITIQINTREYNYAYTSDSSGYAQMEKNSKKEQERILGKRLYRSMDWFDSKLKIYF